MKKRTRAIALCCAAVAVLAGCGGRQQEKNELKESAIEVNKDVPSWKANEESADLSWYINFDWFAQEWGNDLATQYITEDTNVNVTYQSGTDDQLNAMLASGDLPDIITIDGASPLVREAEKFAIPLDELAAMYDPYFLEHAAKEEIVKFFTREDGHLYGYPNFSTTAQDYEEGGVYGNQGFLVREDIYEQIGRPDMTTPEGFLGALQMVYELDIKDGNGNSVVPFGITDFSEGNEQNGIFQRTLADFLGVPMLDDNKEFIDRRLDEDVTKWMKVITEARREGYTDPDLITMAGQDKDARISNGVYFAYFSSDILSETDALSLWTAENPDKVYVAVEGPKSSNGRERTLAATGIEGWTQTFITINCKDPQKAMELITYLVSEEGDTVMNYGREGETYEVVDGVPVMNADLLEFKQTDPGAFEKEVGLTTHLWLQDSSRLSRNMGGEQFPNAIRQAKEWSQEHIVPQMEMSSVESSLSREANRNNSKIDQRWAQTVAAILNSTDNETIDRELEDFIKYRDENGWDEIVKEYNTKIAENVQKLK